MIMKPRPNRLRIEKIVEITTQVRFQIYVYTYIIVGDTRYLSRGTGIKDRPRMGFKQQKWPSRSFKVSGNGAIRYNVNR